MTEKEPTSQSDDVVDAEFEPIEDIIASKDKLPRKRAAWPLVWGLFFIAIIAGAVLGVIASNVLKPQSDQNNPQLTAEVKTLLQQQNQIKNQIALLDSSAKQNKINAKQYENDLIQLTEQLTSIQTNSPKPAQEVISPEQLQEILLRLQQIEDRPGNILSNEQSLDLGQVLAPLEQRLLALENQSAEFADITAIKARLLALEAREITTDNDFDLSQILSRLSRLETSAGITDQSAAKKLLLADLKLAAQGSAPFPVQYAAMNLQFPNHTELRQLAKIAANGAPTRSQLSEQLKTLIPEILLQSSKPADDASLGTKAGAALRGLVLVRRTDGKGSDLEIKLNQIEKSLLAGDLNNSIQQMQSLSGPAAIVSQNWIRGALARQKIEQVLSSLLDEQTAEAKQ